jgi:ArsR family transcriptional regulator
MERSIDEMSEILRLAGEKTRLTILSYLKEREFCVCELVNLLGISQPAISQHLRKMWKAGIVTERRQGTWIYYRLNTDNYPYLMYILKFLPLYSSRFGQDSLIEASCKVVRKINK